MPSVQDILDAADLLQVHAIRVDQVKCAAVRNRNSRCRRCEEACIADAISVSNNEVALDPALCVNCGGCVSLCPTSALSALEPTASTVVEAMKSAYAAVPGCAIVACARKGARHEADPDKYAEVPCLAHMTEEELLQLAASGIDDIVLVDGPCETCKYGAASPLIDATIDTAVRLIESVQGEAIITRSSCFPPEVLEPHKANIRGESRRGLLFQTGKYVKNVAGNVASKAIDERLGAGPNKPLTLRDRLGAGKSGKVPPFKPQTNYRILDAMAALQDQGGAADRQLGFDGGEETEREEETLTTRHFGNVKIDPLRCSGCGICVLFCPTEALRYAEFDEPADESMRYLEFHCSDCLQCMLCKDVCLRNALVVDPTVRLHDLFDFEPKLLEIPRPDDHANILGRFMQR